MQDAMRDDHRDPERPWNEFEWEEVLRERDAARSAFEDEDQAEDEGDTPWLDDADDTRLQEISFEELTALMGQMEDGQEDDDHFEEEFLLGSVGGSAEVAEGFGFRSDPLFINAEELVGKLFEALDEGEASALEDSCASLLCAASGAATHLASAIATADCGEPGMTIAYLKRCVAELADTLTHLETLAESSALSGKRITWLRKRLHALREGVVDKLGEARAEWARVANSSE